MEQNVTILEPLTFETIERADDMSMKVLMKYAELYDSCMNTTDTLKSSIIIPLPPNELF